MSTAGFRRRHGKQPVRQWNAHPWMGNDAVVERENGFEVLPGRSVRFDCMDPEVKDVFHATGWLGYLVGAGDGPCYGDLVKQFYRNITVVNPFSDSPILTSTVRGKLLPRISAILINEMAGTPNSGAEIGLLMPRCYPPDTGRKEFLQTVHDPGLWDESLPLEGPIFAEDLNPGVWGMVHEILAHDVLPYRFTELDGTLTECMEVLLLHLYGREPVNLGKLVLCYMASGKWDADAPSSTVLPYGTLITRLLTLYGVPLDYCEDNRMPPIDGVTGTW